MFSCSLPIFPRVRELANTLERSAILLEGECLGAADLAFVRAAGAEASTPAAFVAAGRSLAEVEAVAIRAALARHGGHRRRAAEELGLGLRTLYVKLKRFEIE